MRVVGPDPAPGNGYFFRSDHFPLAKVGIPALSLSDPIEFTSASPSASKAIKDDYEKSRYHQVEDEIQPNWDYAGAVNDMRLLAELGWRIANAPEMPRYHETEQFARPRQNQPRASPSTSARPWLVDSISLARFARQAN
jgi:Zn-dependent M28 family amino/carboxypeptidase